MAFGLGGKDTVEIIIKAIDKSAAAFRSVQTNMQRMEKTAARVRGIIGKLAKATALIGGVAAIAAIAGATKVFMGFEQSIANTASVSGATGKELKKLEDAAREMGKTTAFSASQAADAMYFLGSAGHDTEQIIGSLNGVMQLAGATQSDLASTSETVVSTLNAFEMEAQESDRVANLFAATIANSQATMDKLANSMRYIAPIAHEVGWSLEETTAALGQLYNAGYRGEEAGTILRGALTRLIAPSGEVKNKLDDLGVQLYKMTPAFEKAGREFDEQRAELRELKESYLDLLPAIKEVADEMDEFSDEQAKNRLKIKKMRYAAAKENRELTEAEEAEIKRLELENEKLGISYDELAIKQDDMQEEADKLTDAIDTQKVAVKDAGKAYADVPKELKSIEDIMKEFESVSLSSADAVTIFGQRAGPGMLSLLAKGSEGVATLRGEITDTNAAAKMYETQMNTLKGTIAIFKSALEEVGIVLGGKLSPFLREMMDKFRDAIPLIMNFISKLKEDLQPTFENLKSIFESTKGIIGDLFADIEIGGFIDAINTVTGVIAKFFKFFDDHPNIVKLLVAIGSAIVAWAYIVPVIGGIITAVSGLVALISGGGGLAVVLAALGGPIGIIVLAIAGLFIAWKLNLFGIRDKTKAVVDFVVEKFDKLVEWFGKIKESGSKLRDKFNEKFDDMKDKIGDFSSSVQDKLGLTKRDLLLMATPAGPIVLFKRAWDKNLGGIQDKVREAMDAVKEKIREAIDAIKRKVDEISNLPYKAYQWGRNLIQSFIDGITAKILSLKYKVEGIARIVGDSIKNLPYKAYQWGRNLIQSFIDGITAKILSLKYKVEEVAGIIGNFLGISSPAKKGPLSQLEKWGPNLIKTYAEGIRKGIPQLNNAIEDLTAPFEGVNVSLNYGGGLGAGGGGKTVNNYFFPNSTISNRSDAEFVVKTIEKVLKTQEVI